MMTGFSKQSSTIVNTAADNVDNFDNFEEMLSRDTQWDSLVSTPLLRSNRFDALLTVCDESSDGGRFIEPRSVRVRRRCQDSKQQQRQQWQQPQPVDDNRQPRSSQRS